MYLTILTQADYSERPSAAIFCLLTSSACSLALLLICRFLHPLLPFSFR